MLRSVLRVTVIAGVCTTGCVAPAGPVVPAGSGAASESTPLPPMTVSPTDDSREATPTVSPLRRMAVPAIDDLAARLGVPVDAVEVIDAVEMEWPDTSLGCPAPDFAYAQMMTNGTQLTLQGGDQTYDYRGRTPDTIFLCGPNGPVPPGETP